MRLLSLAAVTLLLAPAIGESARSEEVPPASHRAREIRSLVEKAAALVDAEGRAAFARFAERESEWWQGNTYLFAYDRDLNVLLNPAFPERVGTNPSGERDATGKEFHDEFLKVVAARGAGWVSYLFPKPDGTGTARKWSFVHEIDVEGTRGLIGAGFYED